MFLTFLLKHMKTNTILKEKLFCRHPRCLSDFDDRNEKKIGLRHFLFKIPANSGSIGSNFKRKRTKSGFFAVD